MNEQTLHAFQDELEKMALLGGIGKSIGKALLGGGKKAVRGRPTGKIIPKLSPKTSITPAGPKGTAIHSPAAGPHGGMAETGIYKLPGRGQAPVAASKARPDFTMKPKQLARMPKEEIQQISRRSVGATPSRAQVPTPRSQASGTVAATPSAKTPASQVRSISKKQMWNQEAMGPSKSVSTAHDPGLWNRMMAQDAAAVKASGTVRPSWTSGGMTTLSSANWDKLTGAMRKMAGSGMFGLKGVRAPL